MASNKRITLDGKVLDCPDEYGDWGVHTFEGWWDSPAEKTEQVSRPQGFNGDFDIPVDYQARYVTLTGIFIADSEAKMFDGMNRFNGLLQVPGKLQVVGYGASQWATVQRASGLSIVPATDRVCHWQARVKSNDARKYGAMNTYTAAVGASLEVFHRGNYPATPSFIIRGDMPGGYTITLNGWNYTVTKPLQPGKPHRIDYNTNVLRVNGAMTENSVNETHLTTVPVGDSVGLGLYPKTTGTGTAEMALPDTYI